MQDEMPQPAQRQEVSMNDCPGLEQKSDVMGTKALQRQLAQTKGTPEKAFDIPQAAAQLEQSAVPAPNRTGLPDQLKAGVESLSGISLDNVKVHYNSAKPAQLNALACAQGMDIHVAPGQARHLPHEAWHVVQQAQGQVKPTMQMKLAAPANQQAAAPVQRVIHPNMGAMWTAVYPGVAPAFAPAIIAADSVLAALYNDAAAQLANVDFQQVAGTAPQITAVASPPAPAPYRLDWDTAANLGHDDDFFVGEIIHELAHAASAEMYTSNVGAAGLAANPNLVWANMNLPAPVGAISPVTGLAPNQQVVYNNQIGTLQQNWTDLEGELDADDAAGILPAVDYNHLYGRIQYALFTAFLHNDTVLGDILYYLQAKALTDSRTYRLARRMLKEANDRRQQGFWANAGTEVRRVDSQAWWFQFWKW